jgi:iron complex outermembrane receptor protein
MDVSFAGGRIYALSYKKYLTKGSIRVKAYGNNITHIMDDSKRPDVPIRMDMPGKSNTYGAFAQAEFNVGKKHHLILTPDYYFNQSFADMTMYPNSPDRPDEPVMYMITWPDVYRHSGSFQVTDHFTLNDSNSFHFNAKYEYVTSSVQSEFGKKQLEAVGFDGEQPSTYHLASGMVKYMRMIKANTTVFGSVGYAERQPTVTEGFGYYIFNSQDGYDYIGDPTLAKEKAVKLSIGAQTEVKKIHLSGTVFHYQFSDYILGVVDPNLDGMTIGANGTKVFENLPSASISGVELDIRGRFCRVLNVQNTTTLSYGVDHNHSPLPLIPPLRNTTNLRLHIKSYTLRASAILSASQAHFSSGAGEQFTLSYSVLNIGASKEIKMFKQQAYIGLSADNIFDAYYWDHLDWNSIPRPGRSINGQFKIMF